jgi:hypothetical protein
MAIRPVKNGRKMKEKNKEVYFLIFVVPGHPELTRLVHGVWDSYEGAKLAFDVFKKSRPEFDYAIASYPLMKEGEGLE